ncbi:hypothetical protein E2C01_015789 [Portunus trituberculatus]|uniref:Uncharacterized protein n=1 Tax=Portunus trituberculatus TaxID=210409 RepID=A0A5B7DNJ5_PORTR|nr:hypothetical protein [Portunus trituberculatus]
MLDVKTAYRILNLRYEGRKKEGRENFSAPCPTSLEASPHFPSNISSTFPVCHTFLRTSHPRRPTPHAHAPCEESQREPDGLQ